MARKKNASIISQLDTKNVELVSASENAKEQAEWHASQVGILKSEASVKDKQSAAVREARDILEKAGVTL